MTNPLFVRPVYWLSGFLACMLAMGLLQGEAKPCLKLLMCHPPKAVNPEPTLTPLTNPADYPPPDKDSLQAECGPMRSEVIRLSHKPFYEHTFYRPRMAYLRKKYYECLNKYEHKQWQFLKHVEVRDKPIPMEPPNTPSTASPSGVESSKP